MEYKSSKKYIIYHFILNALDLFFIVSCFDTYLYDKSTINTNDYNTVIICYQLVLLLRFITNICDWISWIRIIKHRNKIFHNYEVFRRWIYIQSMFRSIYYGVSIYNILHLCESITAIILSNQNISSYSNDLNYAIHLVYIAGYFQLVRLILYWMISFSIFQFPYHVAILLRHYILQPSDKICCLCENHSYETETSLRCGHKYHRHCACAWFQRNSRCPICDNFVLFYDFTV
jgi:hypothetical protein